MADVDKELLKIFIEEASELLGSLSAHLNIFEQNPQNTAKIEDLKRDLHTLKGSARMVGQTDIGNLAHEMETLVIATQGQRVPITHTFFDIAKAASDRMSVMVELLSKNEPLPKINDILQRIRSQQISETQGERTISEKPESATEILKAQSKTPMLTSEFIRIRGTLLEKLNSLSTENTTLRVGLEQYVGNIGQHLSELKQEIKRLEMQLSNLGSEIQSYIAVSQDFGGGHQYVESIEFDRYTQLDQMSNVLRETAYDISNVVNVMSDAHAHTENILLNQARISTELQHRLSDTRLTPFESIVPRLGRITRQVAEELGKQVDFKVVRSEGEMDRNILEQLIPSLDHILRNAIDHGIESKEERRKKGKPEVGKVEVNFIRKGTYAAIEIQDDGAGIDVLAVRKKAIEIGRLKKDESLTDDELLRLILEPGFSTRDTVTEISGRGVGLDVVNTAINELGGSISIESEKNKGTRIIVRFPFTTSLNRVLVFSLRHNIYGIQLNSVDQVILMEQEEMQQKLSQDKPMLQLGDKTYHVHYLGTLLSKSIETINITKRKNFPIILYSAPDYPMALIVDSILFSRELVIKALGAQFKLTNECIGGTLLGDGRVVYILDLYNLSRRAIALLPRVNIPIAFGKEQPIEKTGKALVMVVDDSISVRTVTKRVLEQNGYQVLTAKDGIEALQELEIQNPDIILLDLDMPRMDGFEFAATLRREERFKSIPVIVISSRIISLESERRKELQLEHYIKKPFQESDLIREIEIALGNPL